MILFVFTHDANASREASIILPSKHASKEQVKNFDDLMKRLSSHGKTIDFLSAQQFFVSTKDIAEVGDFIVSEEEMDVIKQNFLRFGVNIIKDQKKGITHVNNYFIMREKPEQDHSRSEIEK